MPLSLARANSSSPARTTTRSSFGHSSLPARRRQSPQPQLRKKAGSSSRSRASRGTNVRSRTSHSAPTAAGLRARRGTTRCACGTGAQASLSRHSEGTLQPSIDWRGAQTHACSSARARTARSRCVLFLGYRFLAGWFYVPAHFPRGCGAYTQPVWPEHVVNGGETPPSTVIGLFTQLSLLLCFRTRY